MRIEGYRPRMFKTLLLFVVVVPFFTCPSLISQEGKVEKNKAVKEKNKIFLGVSLKGMSVTRVMEDSSASSMGIIAGDEIKAWCKGKATENAKWVEMSSVEELKMMFSEIGEIGDTASLKVVRDNKETVLTGKLKERPKPKLPEAGDWTVSKWFQADEENPPKLEDYKGKTLVMFFFQHW